jgi:peptidoglycan/LPS O-acetylase OafA/YrhL
MKKWQIIDLVRSFSVLVVLADHSYSNPPLSKPWMSWLWGRFCCNGYYGIILFFVVSGFLITHVIAHNQKDLFDPNVPKFYVQRIGRIWPLFFLSLLLGLAVYLFSPKNGDLYTNYFPGREYGFWFWLSIPTFMFNWFLLFNVFSPVGLPLRISWTICVEEQFYFLYPLVLKKLENGKKMTLFFILLMVTGILAKSLLWAYWPTNPTIRALPFVMQLDVISIGILLYLGFIHYAPFFSKNKNASKGVCVFGLFMMLFAYFGANGSSDFMEVLIPDALGLGLFCFLLGGLHLDFFESRLLKTLSLPGKYCFGCYLLHPTILIFIRSYIHRMNFLMGYVVFAALTTLAAAVSYHFFEAPLNRFIRKRFEPSPFVLVEKSGAGGRTGPA